jgi:hypothetical protein
MRQFLNIAGALVLGCALVCAGCTTQSTEPEDTVSGEFPLITYDGTALPADLGPLGPKGESSPSGCHASVVAGKLQLDSSSGKFSYDYEIRNSCDKSLLSLPMTAGDFVQEGTRLHFTIQGADTTIAFSGQLLPDRIQVRELEFAR